LDTRILSYNGSVVALIVQVCFSWSKNICCIHIRVLLTVVRPIAGFLVAEDQLVWRTKVTGERKEGSNDVSRGGIQCMEEGADNSLLTRNRVSHFEFERTKQN